MLGKVAETPSRQKTKVPAAKAGTFFVLRIVTNFNCPDAAGTPGCPNDRRPVAPRQQVSGGREHPVPAVRAGGLIPIPVPRFAARPDVAACARAAAASATWPDPRRGPQWAARCLRRDVPARHWQGVAAATSGSFADAPRRLLRALAGFRSEPALASLRISAFLVREPARVRLVAE